MKMKMKMLTISMTLTLAATSLSSIANTVVFKPANDDLATQACYLAATDGLSAAKTLVKANGYNFSVFKSDASCNGISLARFANKYQQPISVSENVVLEPAIKFVPKDNSPESMVCIDALVIGEQKARTKYAVKDTNIICNNKDIKAFVREYKKQNFIVSNFVK